MTEATGALQRQEAVDRRAQHPGDVDELLLGQRVAAQHRHREGRHPDGALRRHQRVDVFGPLGLEVRKNRLGYVAFLVGYQALCSVAALAGYAQELAGTRRRWK